MEIVLPGTLRWQPGARHWPIPVSAWDTGSTRNLWLRRVWLDGRPVARRNIVFPGLVPVYTLPVGVKTSGEVDFPATLAAGRGCYSSSWLALKAANLPAFQTACGSHALELEFVNFTGISYRASTTLLVAALPDHPRWQPVELQLHTAGHDDGHWPPAGAAAELAGQGYRALYLTPHADLIAGHWKNFGNLCRELSEHLAVFPGLEIATRNDAGHLLVYGLTSLEGWLNSSASGQELIDRANRLPGFTASVTVAHPFGRPAWPWKEEPVVAYSGLEVFSGIQLHFDLQSHPVQLWLQEVERLSGRLAQTGFLPSVRAGSDWHEILPYPGYVTYVYLPDGWNGLAWAERKFYLDLALRRGNTVASRHGGLGYFLLNDQPPGTLLTLPSGAVLESKIYWQALARGNYQLFLFQGNNLENPAWQAEITTGNGQLHTWTCRLPAPLRPAFYWLYVTGADQVLTTPVYII